MDGKALHKLNIDPEFKALIRPLTEGEYARLETNLLTDGCLDPLVIWNGTIVDGHNRYEICHKYGIPFAVIEKKFDCREAAMAWICSLQLGRRNLSDETRRYLIGLQYESERLAAVRRNAEEAQYKAADGARRQPPDRYKRSPPSGHTTAQRIARENHVSPQTVLKYVGYTRAMELLRQKAPEIVPRILSGEFKISQDNIVELSALNPAEIQKVIQGIETRREIAARYKGPRAALQRVTESKPRATIKDMPNFDPDAEAVGLALTIPSWVSSIGRCETNANLEVVSARTKEKLTAALSQLIEQAKYLLKKMEGDPNG